MADTQTLEGNVAARERADAAPGRGLWRRLEPVAYGTSSIVLLLLVWQFVPYFVPLKAGTKLFFTVPSQVIGTLWTMIVTGSLWAPLGVSASAFALGLALAIVVGLPLGILLGRSNTLNAMFDPFITAFNAIAAAGLLAALDALVRHRPVVEGRRRVSRRAVSAAHQYL